jgi:hypothetical protein
VKTYIIWVPVQNGDTLEDAQKKAKSFTARNTKHYFDEANGTAISLGKTLNLPPSEWGGGDDKNGGAWDVYVLFEPGALWQDRPPTPAFWTHQLDNVTTHPRLNTNELKEQIELL